MQGISDLNYGTLEQISRLSLSLFNLHRVQWNPGDELFFSMLDNHNLYLVDPNEMRAIERFSFNLKTCWSEWNPNDRKTIAVCGTESQTRFVDIRSGSSVHTIILGAASGLASHRATRCLWSKQDSHCLIIGDNEGYLHVYDTRHSTRPLLRVGDELGQISGMSFTKDQTKIITSHGTENHLVEWVYDRCQLRAQTKKFKKREVATESGAQEVTQVSARGKGGTRKKLRPNIPLPVDAYIRCQFYVSERHIFCPVPSRVKKSKEIYIYDLSSGLRLKTLKSDAVLCQGVYSVTGLLPDSLVLYVGGRGRLRAWTLDEDHQRKMEEKKIKFHLTNWDSDEDT